MSRTAYVCEHAIEKINIYFVLKLKIYLVLGARGGS